MSDLSRHWTLDPEIAFLNHGSFGACPRAILDEQQRLRAQLEREPVRFFFREAPALLDESRAILARFIGADAEGIGFVPNATNGVNAVLRSLSFAPGDELLTTDHAYNACKNVLEFVASASGARVVIAQVPFPIASEELVVSSVMAAVTDKTRLALLDHVTSPTGLVWPIAQLVAALAARGIDTLVDGAHAPGMLDLDVAAVGAAYYTGNCHKWLCAPKGAGFLHVREDRRELIRPTSISHGANAPTVAGGPSRFRVEFDWTGTDDPTAYMCVGRSIEYLGGLVTGGWPEIRARNRALALAGRKILCEALDQPAPTPESMIGSLAAVLLPDGESALKTGERKIDPLQDALLFQHRIEVPVVPWPRSPKRLIRISMQQYNDLDQVRRLAAALIELLNR
jgi:isopenicillin-N epimerase